MKSKYIETDRDKERRKQDKRFTILTVISILSGKFLLKKSFFVGFINGIALVVSWYFNKSVLWALFHFMFGFWYLVYQSVINYI